MKTNKQFDIHKTHVALTKKKLNNIYQYENVEKHSRLSGEEASSVQFVDWFHKQHTKKKSNNGLITLKIVKPISDFEIDLPFGFC